MDKFTLLLLSNCVTIRAGEDDSKFTVHEALLSKSGSPSLQKLVEPGWKESSEGCIDWRHTSSQTVERVLTWLYLRDYHSPDPVPREIGIEPDETPSRRHVSEAGVDSQPGTQTGEGIDETEVEFNDPPLDVADEPAPEPVAEVLDPADEPEPVADVVLEEPQPEVEPAEPAEPDLLEAENSELQNAIFESCSIRPLTPLGKCIGVPPVTTAHKTAAGRFEGLEFPHKYFSYGEPLLAHLEVYSFAKYHLLSELQELALQRSIVTLRKMDCTVELAEQEVSKAVEFVYANIPADRGNEEPMRKLLSQFAAMNYTSLLHGSFEALIARGGDFALDLARKLSRRLLAHGVSDELVQDELEDRIQNLEAQLQERDREIRKLNESLNEVLVWGRGISKKGKRR
ncbi:hypothetical protein AYO21_02484 [Fonsecaea monophora]|uniref:BTB domain-containing protein n=1 Tax=Fonsecaea monophora TaxID=254056 RepID=A0A177FG47_9EURO|nr:hypothetical protein AYO21_02484 [Fonsecaea monophora]OAG43198.1 hypothetical protein AYO21_02484 [Fonsecaea monophora]